MFGAARDYAARWEPASSRRNHTNEAIAAHPDQPEAGTDPIRMTIPPGQSAGMQAPGTWPGEGGRRGDMHGRTRPEPIQRAAGDARREALFVSALQPSDTPTADMIAGAIIFAMQRFGPRGCAAQMAQEFGEHPEAAAARMQWARELAA